VIGEIRELGNEKNAVVKFYDLLGVALKNYEREI
jgi:hypothetical protein